MSDFEAGARSRITVDEIAIHLGVLENGVPPGVALRFYKFLTDLSKQTLRLHRCRPHPTKQTLTLSCDLPFRFRGAGDNHIVFVGEITDESQQSIEVASKESAARKSICIFFCLTQDAESHLETQRHLLNSRCIVVGVVGTRQVFLSPEPRAALRDAILERVSRRSLIPFVTSEPAEGGCFFGRETEVEKLTSGDQDYALCGAGGIGKSSLLRQMRWSLRSRRDDRFSRLVEVDMLGMSDLNAAARFIAVRITPTREAHDVSLNSLEPFLRRVRSGDARFREGPIDLVLDEMDTVLSIDRRSTTVQPDSDSRCRPHGDHSQKIQIDQTRPGTRYPLMQVLRHCRIQGLIRLTVSGRQETNTILEDTENPFSVDPKGPGGTVSRLRQLRVEPLTTPEAESMLIKPLEDLKYLDRNEQRGLFRDALQRLAKCKGIPFHIAELGLNLIDELTPRLHSTG